MKTMNVEKERDELNLVTLAQEYSSDEKARFVRIAKTPPPPDSKKKKSP